MEGVPACSKESSDCRKSLMGHLNSFKLYKSTRWGDIYPVMLEKGVNLLQKFNLVAQLHQQLDQSFQIDT